jgi:hypothetical protein
LVYVLHVSSRACFLSFRCVFLFFSFPRSGFVGVRLTACEVVNEEAVPFVLAGFSKGSQSLSRSRISFAVLYLGMGMCKAMIPGEVLPSMHGDLLVGGSL